MTSLDDALAVATKNNRVCPLQPEWNRLYELLPDRRRRGAGWEPALPLILAAWHDSPPFMKAIRLRKHIEWAAEHGALQEVHAFMESLPEQAWHHFGE